MKCLKNKLIRNTSFMLIFSLLFFFCTGFQNNHIEGSSINLQEELEEKVPYDAHLLVTPFKSNKAYLVNNNNEIVNTWSSQEQGFMSYLLPNGNLLNVSCAFTKDENPFTEGGACGIVQEIDSNNEIVWDFTLANEKNLLHHGVEVLPNGNILMIAWEKLSKEVAIELGRKPDLLANAEFWPDKIIEVNPKTDEIVWEWKSYDHFVQDINPALENYGTISEHPELINVNYSKVLRRGKIGPDFMHTNAVSYNPHTDQIMLSIHSFSEIWIIDHSTTKAEAASHEGGKSGMGGDILYRYGNPETYAQGTRNDRTLFGQHDAQWIPAGYPGEGNVLIFNNGMKKVREYSTVDEIQLKPGNEAELIWRYQEKGFFSSNISGAQRLPNGNTLICNGQSGTVFEVTQSKEKVWEFQNNIAGTKSLFTAQKYQVE